MFKSKFIIFFISLSINMLGQEHEIEKKKDKISLFPVVSTSLETSWQFGVAAASAFQLKNKNNSTKDSITKTSNFDFIGVYTLRKQIISALRGTLFFPKNIKILTFEVSYSFFPDRYWGLGSFSKNTAEEPYDYQQIYIYPHFQKKIGSYFYWGILGEFQRVFNLNYKSGGSFESDNIPYVNGRSYSVLGLGGSLTFDSRNHSIFPVKGWYLQLLMNNFSKYIGSDFNYRSLVLDARTFISLSKNQKHVLAFQGYYATSSNDFIPNRSLARLGGMSLMRGFYSGRYRDKGSIVIQSEYRFPVYKFIGGTAFGATGNVFNQFSSLSTNFKISYGLGLRLRIDEHQKQSIRIDYGRTSDQTDGIYLSFNEAF